MRKQLIIMFAAILTFSSYPMIHAHAQQIDIGDPETHSDYYWYGNLTVQRNESLSIINEIFFIYGRSLNVNGTLSVQNSTLILNNTEISITRGTFIIGNSSVEGNGSITMDASTFRSFNSTVFDGYAGTFSAFNSSVYILRSNISGQSTSDEFNYTMARYYNNSYQPGGQVSLKMENYSHGYAYRLNISVEYEYANASHPASIYVVYENESQYLHLSASTTMTTSYFTFILQRPSANPLPEIYVYSNESDLEVYNITALAIANDTYYLYGSQHYDLYLSNSIMYSVDSKFDLNDRPLYLDDGLISPYATGIYLYHSAAYMVSSGSGIANITRIPFISSASIVYYMSAVNITYLLDGRSYDYNGSVYYANGQAIDLNSTVSALSRYVYYSTSVHEVPVWIFNGTITYKGNYEIDVYGRMEYFSISPYPYLSNVLQTFVGSVTIPQLNITIPGVLYTGTDQTISIGYKSSYAGISNAYIDVHLINGSESILIFRIHIMNLSADSTRNATENLNLSISPGMYQAYFTTNSSDIIFIDQYVNVVVEDHVNLTMRWYYRYTLPFHDLKFDLSMFDASGDPAEGGLQMYFLSGNSTAISKNTFIHVSPSSYDNLTVFANSSKNLTSVFVGLRYNESMFNYIPNQTAKIRLRPIFSNYDVKFSVFGQQIYPMNISINGIFYVIKQNNTIITMPNGTYSASAVGISGYHIAIPRSFSIDGSNITVNIYISKVLYGITFKSNLKSGFSILINGNEYFGDSVSLPNGTYCLTVDAPSGYDPIRENMTVNGSNLTIFLNFQRAIYKMRMMINGSISPQNILINGSTYSVPGSINISLTSGIYNIIALNSTYLRTNFRSTIDVLSNTTLYIDYYRPYSKVYINASGYADEFEIKMNSSYYYVHAGDTIHIPFGLYSIRAENVQGYSETYGKNISIDDSSAILNITFSRLRFMIHIATDIPADIVFGNTREYGQNFSVLDFYGNYDLSISRPGYYPISESVMLNSNMTLEFALRAILYKITIEADVDSFTIYAGNKTYSVSGNDLTIYLPYGEHSIILQKDGYSNIFETIDVSSNSTIFLKMHRLPPESIIRGFIVDNYQDIATLSISMIAIYLLIIRHLRIVGRNSAIMRPKDRKRD